MAHHRHQLHPLHHHPPTSQSQTFSHPWAAGNQNPHRSPSHLYAVQDSPPFPLSCHDDAFCWSPQTQPHRPHRLNHFPSLFSATNQTSFHHDPAFPSKTQIQPHHCPCRHLNRFPSLLSATNQTSFRRDPVYPLETQIQRCHHRNHCTSLPSATHPRPSHRGLAAPWET
uniref:Uncharacterized protein n=1 Tax=Arundo donax TaxID=35708 RepID=A0A0A9EI31_ARUDO